MAYKTIAIDGLSLAGKSTMVQMLFERSLDAEVVRENTFDPYRSGTARLNTLMKELESFEAVKRTAKELEQYKDVLEDAWAYGSQFSGSLEKQALLAYMFTAGRKVVDQYVREVRERRNTVLDRWQITGWAYQTDPEGYSWQEIKRLNAEFGILVPDIQILLTCPIEQIPVRRAYREKLGVGTAGQMSRGREHIILPAFLEIYNQLRDTMPIYMFENIGTPVEDLEGQIRQAIPTFKQIEAVASGDGFRLKQEQITDEEAFWLDPERLRRIYERQTT